MVKWSCENACHVGKLAVKDYRLGLHVNKAKANIKQENLLYISPTKIVNLISVSKTEE